MASTPVKVGESNLVQRQRTIGREVEYTGRGLFYGKEVALRLKPAVEDSGVHFVRTDLPSRPTIPASARFVVGHNKHVHLKSGPGEVEGTEHLLAALAGLGIDNLEVEVTGKELPAADGSALPFVNLMREAGIVEQQAKKKVFALGRHVVVDQGNSSLIALPYKEGLELFYFLDFGFLRQHYQFLLRDVDFVEELAPARTFSLSSSVEEFKRLGLGGGVSDENSFLVCEDGVFVTPLGTAPARLRFPEECVRHKLLDLLGDLYLSGVDLRARIIAIRSGHSLNVALAKKILQMQEKSVSPRRATLRRGVKASL